jgi:DNA-binding CsgD family transcriptional regulator
MPLLTEAALALVDELPGCDTPQAVVDLLQRTVSVEPHLSAFAAWRLAHPPDNFETGYVVGQNLFAHASVPAPFWDEFFALARKHGPSVMAHMAWRNRGPFTFTECRRATKPIGNEVWIFDLMAKYGIRDGFYCPTGTWMVLFWSSRVLALSKAHRALLFMLAIEASLRLQEILRPREVASGNAPVFLTARELSVLQRLSRGRTSEKIARELKVSTPTVRTYVRRAMIKLKA